MDRGNDQRDSHADGVGVPGQYKSYSRNWLLQDSSEDRLRAGKMGVRRGPSSKLARMAEPLRWLPIEPPIPQHGNARKFLCNRCPRLRRSDSTATALFYYVPLVEARISA